MSLIPIKNIDNSPIIDIDFPKVFRYVPFKENNKYNILITDVRIKSFSKVEIKLTLPEIKGKGSVSYLKNYKYLLLDYFEIFIQNREEPELSLYKVTGEDVLILTKNYKNQILTNLDNMICNEKKGTYEDCIIFEEIQITIPIILEFGISNFPFFIFPETKLRFEFKLNPITDIISYNKIFQDNSLKNLIKYYNNQDLNVQLEFINTPMDIPTDIAIKHRLILETKKTTGKNGTIFMNSDIFDNAFGIYFYMRSSIFNNSNKFIINLGINTKEQVLIEKWILKILKDLLVITDKDISLKENIPKEYDEKSIFKKVINNRITFNKKENKYCDIFIENVPKEANIYYHTNILTFIRRYDIKNILNISEYFTKIKGIYFSDQNKISFLMNEIKHNIDIGIISIPVDIWNNHTYNTSTGDLRSTKSKNTDFIINNKFILGMDFLSKDKGYENIIIKAGKTNIENLDLENKIYNQNTIYIPHEFDSNNYPSINYIQTAFRFSYVNEQIKCIIKSEPMINFNNFTVDITWNKYSQYDPKYIYDKIPVFHIIEGKIIEYNIDERKINILKLSNFFQKNSKF